MSRKKFNYIDLYSGIGGIKYALDSIGGRCIFSAEINKPAIKTYIANHEDIKHNPEFSMDEFSNLSSKEILSMEQFKDIDVDLISAGFPCQTFSIAGKRMGFDSYDTRGTQFFNVINLAKALKPKIILLENVKHLVKHDDGNTFNVIKESLSKEGYEIKLNEIISPLDIGVPQNRERIFIVAVKRGTDIDLSELKLKKIENKNNFVGGLNILDKESDVYEGIEITKDQLAAIKTWENFVKIWFKNRSEDEKTIPALWLNEMFEEKNPIKDSHPEWKKIMIKRMLDFKEKHSEWIDDWYKINKDKFSKRIHAKLEWNAGIEYAPRECIAVIRQSGVRFKRPNFFPALVAVVDIPIIFDSYKKKWRNISLNEMLRLQSIDTQKFIVPEELRMEDIYKQLGNSVNIEVVKKVAETFRGKI